jgi:hypothetical protein
MAINMTCTMGDCPVPHLFANNIIYNCNVALNIGLHAMARNNLIVGNHIGIRSDGSAEGGASSYNDVWGNVLNYQGITPGTGAISDNPVFVNPADPAGSDGIFWTADDGFLLQANSPAIDAGDPADDYSKELNYPAGRIDLGAYGNTPLATKGYCVYPSSGMVVDKNMVFCSGKYEYDLSPLGVFLEVEAGDLEISCEEDTVIAGAGRRWQGIGVYANGYSNTSIIGCNFQNFNFGLFFWQPGHVFLNNVKVQENKRGVLVVQGDLEVQTSEISDNRWLDIGVYGGDLIIDDQTASHEPMIRPIKRDN